MNYSAVLLWDTVIKQQEDSNNVNRVSHCQHSSCKHHQHLEVRLCSDINLLLHFNENTAFSEWGVPVKAPVTKWILIQHSWIGVKCASVWCDVIWQYMMAHISIRFLYYMNGIIDHSLNPLPHIALAQSQHRNSSNFVQQACRTLQYKKQCYLSDKSSLP